ncbi:membrane protein [Bathymodiolus azoricus thioautotrophic gill symbiont]|uniref:Membrane protein n=1 Tax=Bathymodiolus azoricus thioautotrophic gill symbiont TaxID=235205 RepID=A0A1H6M2N7_9GAMM|nr:membrane protein [Bathymodiolus azoricus thioautotrophic gill symbiont]
MWCWIKNSFVDLDGWKNGWFWFVWVGFLRGDYLFSISIYIKIIQDVRTILTAEIKSSTIIRKLSIFPYCATPWVVCLCATSGSSYVFRLSIHFDYFIRTHTRMRLHNVFCRK